MQFSLPAEVPVKTPSSRSIKRLPAGKVSKWASEYTPAEMKERFLQQLKTHRVQQRARKEIGLPNATYTVWRKQDKEFREAIARITDPRAVPVVERNETIPNSTLEHPVIGSKQDVFLKRYRKSRSREAACVYGNITAIQYSNWRDPNHDLYDKDFDDLMASEEQFELWAIEENALLKASDGTGDNVKFFLERRFRDKYGPPVKRTETTVGINHWFSRQGEVRAREISKNILDTTRNSEESDRISDMEETDRSITRDREGRDLSVERENGSLLPIEAHIINSNVDSS